MSLTLIDSHCHLDLGPLKTDFVKYMTDAESVGVRGFVVPGVHPDGWPGISSMSAEYRQIFPAYGIHPMHADIVTAQVMENLLMIAPLSVAIGEVGLDSSCKVSMSQQEPVFREQIRIALKHDLPILVHCKQAFQRVLTILQQEGAEKTGGIMHAYSGSPEMAHEFIRLGFVISISGTVTLNNAVKPLKLARELSMDNLVLETDAPDMTPERYRGRFNRPEWIMETAVKVAELKGISLEDVAVASTANLRRVLRLDGFSA